MVSSILSIASIAGALTLVSADASSYADNAKCACDQMMRSYQVSDTGLWGKDDWWQSGIMLTALAELSSLDSGYNGTYFDTFATTYSKAPGYGGYTGFIDQYDDDEGWWGVAWLAAYDLTQNPDYLNLAISIEKDIAGNKASCGGIIWEKGGNYLASIANELYIELAAGIANRVSSDQKQAYVDSATSVWDWFFSVGVVGDDNLVVDGVDGGSCQVSQTTQWSYNQGVILSAAVELYTATGDSKYLDSAGKIADATVQTGSKFTGSNGVITECSTDSCNDTSAMFKGALFRGLRQLQGAAPNDAYKQWLETNAQALWNNALSIVNENGNTECQLGSNFNGPVGDVDVITQAAGLESLIAAWVVSS